jgi:hypothetical protein
MIALTRKYPAEVVDTACETARRHGTFRYRTLVELCKRKPVPQGHLFTRDHELIRPLSEYEELLREGGVQ